MRSRLDLRIPVSEDERAMLTREADAEGITRAELLRQRVLGGATAPVRPFNLSDYQRIVQAALKGSNGAISRTVAEAIAGTIITTLTNDA